MKKLNKLRALCPKLLISKRQTLRLTKLRLIDLFVYQGINLPKRVESGMRVP